MCRVRRTVYENDRHKRVILEIVLSSSVAPTRASCVFVPSCRCPDVSPIEIARIRVSGQLVMGIKRAPVHTHTHSTDLTCACTALRACISMPGVLVVLVGRPVESSA